MTAEHEYVEYQLRVENGRIVGCEFFGEGKQVEPLAGVKVYKPAGENAPDWFLKRVERRLIRAFSKLETE